MNNISNNDISKRADFSFVRYAQCWEDADVLLAALDVKNGDRCLSIASGGENSFSLLSCGAEVTAVDLSLPQLAVTDLKRAAYRVFDYDQFLFFIGVRDNCDPVAASSSTASSLRDELFRELEAHLQPDSKAYFEQNIDAVRHGIVLSGKFENYFRLFRTRALPLIHSKKTVDALLGGFLSREARNEFYQSQWDTFRYGLLFRIFFSKSVMGKHGRDAELFKYVKGSVADRIKERVAMGLIEVDGNENPYLHFILKGNFGTALPHALRRENFQKIKDNLDGLRLIQAPMESHLHTARGETYSGCNLSDIFEYMSQDQMNRLYEVLLSKTKSGGRLAYWNMLAARQADPDLFGEKIITHKETADELLKKDKAFFYSRFVLEEKR